MSANFFGNNAQGYFGFYFGPTEESNVSSVAETLHLADAPSSVANYAVSILESISISDSNLVQTDFFATLEESVSISESQNSELAGNSVPESVSISDSCDCVLTPNPTPPAPQPSPAVGGGGGFKPTFKQLSKKIKVNLYSDSEKVVVFGIAKKKTRISSLSRSKIASVKINRFGFIKKNKTPKTKKRNVFAGIVSKKGFVSDKIHSISSVSSKISRFSNAKEKIRGYAFAAGTPKRFASISEKANEKTRVSVFVKTFGSIKTSKTKGYATVSGKQIAEFSQDEMEMIMMLAEEEFFN